MLGPSPFAGRLSGRLRFGASGESLAGVVGNLAGAGELRLGELRVPNAEPGALARALPRALNDNDPLTGRRLQAILGEELAEGAARRRRRSPRPATMVGGVLRMSPFAADRRRRRSGRARSRSTSKTLSLDARGTLTSRAARRAGAGAPPYVALVLARADGLAGCAKSTSGR